MLQGRGPDTIIVVIPLKTRPPKTVKDYMKLPEGVRAELIEGELLMSPSPRSRHQRIVFNTHVGLRDVVEGGGLGLVFEAPLDVHLPLGDIVQPDVIVVLKRHLKIVKDWIRGIPDIVVEVVSPDTVDRDRFTKRHTYARNRVKAYWLVDDSTRSVEVLRLSRGRYVTHGYFERADTIHSPALPGLALPVRTVFR